MNKEKPKFVNSHIATSDQKLKWWGYGEWVEEPDRIDWEHKGYKCVVLRIADIDGPGHVFGGYLCGYIELPKGHPWAFHNWDNIEASVHGGITYSQAKNGIWTIGFDCAHSGDLRPSSLCERKGWSEETLKSLTGLTEWRKKYEWPEDQYRNVSYAIKECESLAEQAADAMSKIKVENGCE